MPRENPRINKCLFLSLFFEQEKKNAFFFYLCSLNNWDCLLFWHYNTLFSLYQLRHFTNFIHLSYNGCLWNNILSVGMYLYILVNTSCMYFMYGLKCSSLPSQLGLLNTPTASLQRGKTPPNKCPWYDTKQSDGEVPVILELWGMQSTPSLPSLPGLFWLGMVAPAKGPIDGLNRTKPEFLKFTVFSI